MPKVVKTVASEAQKASQCLRQIVNAPSALLVP